MNGGGFVVTDCSQKVVFKVDGSGVLGKKDELLLKDGNGDDLLLIRRKVISTPSKQKISAQLNYISIYKRHTPSIQKSFNSVA